MGINYSVDKFLGILNKAGGPSHKNRFQVFVNFPQQLSSLVDGETLNLMCESAEMPEHAILTEDYASSAQTMRIPYTFSTEILTFSFHANGDYKIYDAFQQWADLIISPETYTLAFKNEIVANDWSVWQLDKQNERTAGMKLFNVFPTAISKIEFSDNATNVIQTFNVSISYDYKFFIPN